MFVRAAPVNDAVIVEDGAQQCAQPLKAPLPGACPAAKCTWHPQHLHVDLCWRFTAECWQLLLRTQ